MPYNFAHTWHNNTYNMSLESLDQYLSVCSLYGTYVSAVSAAFAQLVHPQFSIYSFAPLIQYFCIHVAFVSFDWPRTYPEPSTQLEKCPIIHKGWLCIDCAFLWNDCAMLRVYYCRLCLRHSRLWKLCLRHSRLWKLCNCANCATVQTVQLCKLCNCANCATVQTVQLCSTRMKCVKGSYI